MKIVFGLFRPIFFLISFSPFWLLYLWSNLSYLLFYKLLRYRVKVVRRNLGMVFPTYMVSELQKIEKDFYKHLFDLFFEGIKLLTISEKELMKRCSFQNAEILNSIYKENKNAIIVAGHTGNWEWASGATNLSINHQLQTFYQPLKATEIEQFVLKIRNRFGTKLIPRKKALKVMLSQKDSEQKFATAFLADQSPHSIKKASWVNFFGIDTAFFNGYAALAQKLDIPIVFAYLKKEKRGYYTIETEFLTQSPNSITQKEIVGAFAKKLEREILRQPHNWLWSHKRWKRDRTKPIQNAE